eukprot:Polyplicarium_translucidae@DN4530_c0_g1_i1.p3
MPLAQGTNEMLWQNVTTVHSKQLEHDDPRPSHRSNHQRGGTSGHAAAGGVRSRSASWCLSARPPWAQRFTAAPAGSGPQGETREGSAEAKTPSPSGYFFLLRLLGLFPFSVIGADGIHLASAAEAGKEATPWVPT